MVEESSRHGGELDWAEANKVEGRTQARETNPHGQKEEREEAV
jgi:hypothetical protein